MKYAKILFRPNTIKEGFNIIQEGRKEIGKGGDREKEEEKGREEKRGGR